MRKLERDIMRTLVAEGIDAKVEMTRSNHYRVTIDGPKARVHVVTAGTPGDRRGWHNFVAALRAAAQSAGVLA